MKRETALQEIRQRISCADYLEKSKSYRETTQTGYCCPVCSSGHGQHGTGAVQYYPENNTWHCHACGAGHDVIDAYRAQTGADFNDALQQLAASIGINIEPAGRQTAQQDFAPSNIDIEQPQTNKTGAGFDFNGENDKLTDENKKIAQIEKQSPANYTAYYRKCREFINDPAAASYLQARGISAETAARFKIGFDPQADPAGAPGAMADEYKAHPAPRLIIPCTTGFYIARSIDPKTPGQFKAPNPKGSKTQLFNAAALYSGATVVYICEGVFDALSIIETGGAAIATNGKGNGRLLLQQLQKAPTAAAFIICPDNDDDPETAAQTKRQAQELNAGLKRLQYNSIVYNVAGKHHDVNDALRADPAGLAAAIQEAEKKLNADDITDFLEKVQTEAYRPHRTGLTFFDDLTGGGVINQSLLLLLAAPGTGKTTLCAQLAECMAVHETPVIYINLEMSREQMIAKAISARLFRKGHNKTALQVLQGYKWSEDDRAVIAETAEEYRRESLPYIRYNPDSVSSDIKDILQYLTAAGEAAKAAGKPAPAVIIDYLHLISSRDRIEPQELIKQSVVGLKQYAVDYDTFVVAIVATNRTSNTGGRLTMESGRDSSNIEYTADYQLSLNYFDIDNGKVKPTDVEALAKLQQAQRREMILRVLKGRLVMPGRSVKVLFDAANNTFYGAVDDFLPPEGFVKDDGAPAFDDPADIDGQQLTASF